MSFIVPGGAQADAARLLYARALRGLADGFVSVVLASYLDRLGFSPLEIGAIVTATLVGSAAVTIAAGFLASGFGPVRVLFGATAMMFATGLGFFSFTDFWPLLIVGFAGTLNPSGGDVSVFLPVEQALLAGKVTDRDRTALFARYGLGGALAAAVGALLSGLPALLARVQGWETGDAERVGFLVYGAAAVTIALLYLGVRAPAVTAGQRGGGLRRSRRVVLELSALFSLDSFGGGFVVQSLLVLWLVRRFDASETTLAATFFGMGMLAAFSQLASAWLAARIGLIRTMVYTHLPANAFLVIAAFMPSAPLAIAFLLLRMSLSQMDVPARQSFVMASVPPEERAAAASVTNVPRSLAAAFAPFLAGLMLDATTFGWPLIAAGALKAVYDVALLLRFGGHERGLRPPTEN